MPEAFPFEQKNGKQKAESRKQENLRLRGWARAPEPYSLRLTPTLLPSRLARDSMSSEKRVRWGWIPSEFGMSFTKKDVPTQEGEQLPTLTNQRVRHPRRRGCATRGVSQRHRSDTPIPTASVGSSYLSDRLRISKLAFGQFHIAGRLPIRHKYDET